MSRSSRDSTATSAAPCGCYLAALAFNISIGAWLFDYALYSILGKDVPWYVDAIVGLITAQIMLLVAAVCWVLRLTGMETPFVTIPAEATTP